MHIACDRLMGTQHSFKESYTVAVFSCAARKELSRQHTMKLNFLVCIAVHLQACSAHFIALLIRWSAIEGEMAISSLVVGVTESAGGEATVTAVLFKYYGQDVSLSAADAALVATAKIVRKGWEYVVQATVKVGQAIFITLKHCCILNGHFVKSAALTLDSGGARSASSIIEFEAKGLERYGSSRTVNLKGVVHSVLHAV